MALRTQHVGSVNTSKMYAFAHILLHRGHVVFREGNAMDSRIDAVGVRISHLNMSQESRPLPDYLWDETRSKNRT